MDPRTVIIIALIAALPLAVIMLIALLRGYDISLRFIRRGRRRDDDED